jgi:mono/diheme cytochrome c family protein
MYRSAIAVLVLGLLLPLSAPRAQGDVTAGRKLAIQHCARCHVVGDHNPYGGIGSTPSFQLLARRADYLERFQTFFARRPHPVYVRVPDTERLTDLPSFVAEFTVTPDNIEDLVAFVETLKPK